MPNVNKLLFKEEGCRNKPYYCKLNYPTVGVGKRIGPKNAPLSLYQFAVPDQVAALWLNVDIAELSEELKQDTVISSAWYACNEQRQAILLSMAFQMGVDGLRKFKATLALIAAKQFAQASKEMLNSAWASPAQTPERARRHAAQMQSGEWHTYYRD